MSDKWKFWMKNSGFGGSAPWITLEIHRVNALNGAEYEQMFGTNIGAFHFWQEGTSTKYFRQSDLDIFNESFIRQIHQGIVPKWWDETKRRGETLVATADKMGNVDLPGATLDELTQLFIDTTDAYWGLGVHSSIPIFGGWALQEKLESRLSDAISAKGIPPEEFGKYYTTLTSGDYTSWPRREEEALRKLAVEIKAQGIFDTASLLGEYEERLKQHAMKFDWIPYKWIGPTWSLPDFRQRLGSILTEEPKQKVKRLLKEQAIEQLGLGESIVREFNALSVLGELKEMKGDYMSRAAYQLGKFRAEMQRRFGLTERQTALMLSEDYLQLLAERGIDKEMMGLRQTGFLWHAEDGISAMYAGEEAIRRFGAEFVCSKAAKDKQVYEGTPVYPGKVAAIARKILRYEKDKDKFKEGDVLIVYRTTPHYVPLIGLSSAIITTERGITQHAAQIAREHQIPCIVGITDIIDGVEDGQPLSVDANLGRVEKITHEEYERTRQQNKTKKSINIVRKPLSHYHGPDIIWMDEAANKKTDRNLVGNKAANQIIASKMFNVPRGFILTTASYYQFMAEAGLLGELSKLSDRLESAGLNIPEIERISGDYTAMIIESDVTGFFDHTIRAYNALGASSTVTRSSGIDEDSHVSGNYKGSSFAGIFETYLNHRTADEVINGVKKCWASMFSPRALLYGIKSGFDPSSNQMAVLVQELKNGHVSGVMYTGIDGHTLIEACEGLCDPLVAGRITPAMYVLDSDHTVVFSRAGNQDEAEYIDSDGTYRTRKVQNQTPLRGKDLFELGMIGAKVQRHFGVPQDVEWTATNLVYITQNRDLTAKPLLPAEVAR